MKTTESMRFRHNLYILIMSNAVWNSGITVASASKTYSIHVGSIQLVESPTCIIRNRPNVAKYIPVPWILWGKIKPNLEVTGG